jgi:large subunit ribosomal protein L7Ae
MEKKFEVPKGLVDAVFQVLEEAKRSGKIRKGTNETTKSVERAEAKLVVIAEDVSPPEIIMHIPMLCEEKEIPFVFVPKKSELGAAAGLPVGSSAIAVVNAGEAVRQLKDVVKQLEVLSGKKAKPAEKPAEKPKEVKKESPKKAEKPKEAPKKEEVKEEKPAEKKEAPKKEEKPAEKKEAPKKEEVKEEKKEAPKKEEVKEEKK